ADVVKDYSRTMMIAIAPSDALPRDIEREFAKLERQAKRDLKAEGFGQEQTQFIRLLAVRYRGQSFELEIPFDEEAESDAVARFHETHRERYGHAEAQTTVEIVSVRLRAVGATDKPPLKREKFARRHKARPQRD